MPDNSGLASLVLGTRYRPGGAFAGAAAAFAVHVVLAVTCGSILGLLPHKIVQIAVAVVFLAGAVLVLRADSGDEDEARLKAGGAGFWAVAATSFGVIAPAELGDLSDIVIANDFAVGLALGAVAVPIVVAVLVFGIASAIMSVIGLELGAKLGTAAGEHGEVAAGVILIGVAAAMAAGWLLPGSAG